MALKTPLYDWHAKRGAKIVEFGGWDMPVIYTSINEEHAATRTAAGLFDISHMGRVFFEGPDTVKFLESIVTNQVENLKPGQVRYNLVLDENGCCLDDVLVYRLEGRYMVVVNAGNRTKLVDWFAKHIKNFDCKMSDQTTELAMIACQGPKAIDIAQKFFSTKLADIKYYFCVESTYQGKWCLLSRTGYTGEDGVEAIVPNELAVGLWDELVKAGALPVALGARDTLRLEAGMPLYGHELTESIDPVQAGLNWACKPDKKDFIGKQALLARPANRQVRVGLKLADKRIAREGFEIIQGEKKVGTVASGTFGPTLQASLAMGYVEPEYSKPGTELSVLVRGTPVSAVIVPIPFYQREKK